LIPGERVASGLVWRFGTLDCVSDNLACFGDGFGGSGSFLNIGSHCFYVAKPFPEVVTDVLDPLSDGGSSCGESCDFGAMVEVMALGDEEGGDCRWISSRKNMGYHAMDPKIRTQGAEHGRSWIATKHGDGSLESSNAQRTVERDAELYPGSGPSW
jgi:hypothetical protein